jgi:glycosyltransferase involved in cell wall biosynthesis
VALEAMACGIPVIAVNWGGPQDYLDTSCGILVDPSSPEGIVHGFTEAMQKLIADPILRGELGIQGRKRVEELYDWRKKIDTIIQLYRGAIRDFGA